MKHDFYFFSGTHWDREWYQTFQGFRYRLVKMLDELGEAWEKEPRFGVFHLDGQTAPMEDYAEINPEGAEKIKALVKEGKIRIGPWFVMPDEFNISGESLIRNLMLGHELAKKWGADEAWKFGYICDVFGHVAQLPQILKGFNIDYSLFSRGYYSDTEPYFVWRSPDGSEIINMRIGNKNGYCDFTLNVPEKGWKYNSYEESLKYLPEYMEYLIGATKLPIHIVIDARDHYPIRLETPDYIDEMKKLYPDAEFHHVDLMEAGKALEAYRDVMEVISGEMNYPNRVGFPDLITNVLSSYYPLKKANDECQNRLEKVVEPFSALAVLKGIGIHRGYVKRAYRYLLLNHPHDSIGGCSIDQVHKDMEYRYDQAKEICEALEDDYLRQAGRERMYNADHNDDGVLTLFNPLPFDRNEVVTVDIDMKPGYPNQYSDQAFGFERINSFKILNSDGNEIPYRVISIKRGWRRRIKDQTTPLYDVHTVSLKVSVPAGGMSEYRIIPSEKPSRYLEQMVSGMDYMDNGLVRVDISPNGSVTLTDKKTGRSYQNQLTLVDDGEIGDGWYHANPREDRSVYSNSGRCRIEKVEIGPSKCVFRITKEIEVPKDMVIDANSQYRSDDYSVCTAVFDVGLSEGDRFVDVKLKFINRAKDHRVRLAVPTCTEGEKYFADQAFCFCERRVGIDLSTGSYREYDQYEKSMNGIMGKRDKNGEGLAFVSAEGLHECASTDDAEATLFVTLLRGFKKTVMTNGETRGQLLGEHSYHFVLIPLDGDVRYSDLLAIKDRIAVPVIARYSDIPTAEPVIKPVSDFRVSGKDIRLSVLKPAECGDGSIAVRVYNASDEASEAVIEFPARTVKKASFTNLNEEPCGGSVSVDGGTVRFGVTPWQIKTVVVSF